MFAESLLPCIFCEQDSAPGDEHVFPEAVGGTLRITRVCTGCNSDLGARADAPLSDFPTVLWTRAQLGITGKSGNLPDLMHALLGVGSLLDDPDQRVKSVTPDRLGALPTLELINRKRDVELADGSRVTQYAINADDTTALETIFHRARKKAGLPPLSEQELRLEIDKLERVTIGRPRVLFNPSIDIVSYKRGIAKIAYELAWYWLGDRYLNDPMATTLRAVITGPAWTLMSAEALGLKGQIDIYSGNQALEFWNDRPNSHIGFLSRVGNIVVVVVRVFSCLWGQVTVSVDASRYADVADHDGWFLEIDPCSGATRECTKAEELARIVIARTDANR
jgi:hypothetical protein